MPYEGLEWEVSHNNNLQVYHIHLHNYMTSWVSTNPFYTRLLCITNRLVLQGTVKANVDLPFLCGQKSPRS